MEIKIFFHVKVKNSRRVCVKKRPVSRIKEKFYPASSVPTQIQNENWYLRLFVNSGFGHPNEFRFEFLHGTFVVHTADPVSALQG